MRHTESEAFGKIWIPANYAVMGRFHSDGVHELRKQQ